MSGVDGELCYLSWSDDMSCKTWSQMCGSWYLPKFLLSEESLTHILHCLFNISGEPLWFPVDYSKAVGVYWVSCGVTVLVYRGWGPKMFLEQSPKDLPDSLMYSSGELICGNLNLYISHHFSVICCPYPWKPLEGFGWCWLLWSVPGYPCCFMSLLGCCIVHMSILAVVFTVKSVM